MCCGMLRVARKFYATDPIIICKSQYLVERKLVNRGNCAFSRCIKSCIKQIEVLQRDKRSKQTCHPYRNGVVPSGNVCAAGDQLINGSDPNSQVECM